MDKPKIVSAVQSLLSSAQDRDTDQGVFVYNKALELLAHASTDDEVRSILGKLNRSLAGIEAHGYFTDDEFRIIQNLRSSGYAQVESEADRLISGKTKLGLREHLVAWLSFTAGLPVVVRCPRCNTVLLVTPFQNAEGANIECECGTCSGAMRGL